MSRGVVGFFIGAVTGAAAGFVAGLLLAPRSGAETRSLAAEAATDAWGNVVDAYHEGAERVTSHVEEVREDAASKTDELRMKVDQARARMDQIRSSLVENAGHRAGGAAAGTVSEGPLPDEGAL